MNQWLGHYVVGSACLGLAYGFHIGTYSAFSWSFRRDTIRLEFLKFGERGGFVILYYLDGYRLVLFDALKGAFHLDRQPSIAVVGDAQSLSVSYFCNVICMPMPSYTLYNYRLPV
jgi:hypothetical protein